MSLQGEHYFQVLEPRPYVYIGLRFADACKHHFGIRYGIRQHVPWPDVLEVAADLCDLKADLIVTLGAGSRTDGAKVAALAVANEAFTLDALDGLHTAASPLPKDVKACTISIINIPTSLSGGEYMAPGAATDLRSNRKLGFRHPSMGSQLVILDPVLTVSTPDRVWLSSGMRAVDHCVEGLCSVFFRTPSGEEGTDDDNTNKLKEETEEALAKALSLLLPGLLITRHFPSDLPARLEAMAGVVEANGPAVRQEERSCVMLPSVLRWNRAYGDAWVEERQRKERGLRRDTVSAGDVVAGFVAALGLPTSVGEVGVGRDKLDALAESSEQVLEIVEMAL
ncbi:hypothetical protein B0H63DRAFT_499275 [Podospora didyma]|uniref:Alcohol dehydrogenase iron-type/glycerol dehydrogenase GldA domain-containing protein n=1 Tax=Podospora didyma TaxID=330526 RepID=A0AAE0P8D5_9PEZI|nr:hypothetical protein B0H63DRAFT_499275 [Podospora didyma]